MADEVKPIEEILQQLDPDNARKHTKRNKDAMSESFATFGAARSVVMDGEGKIRAGNGSVEAAASAGIKTVRIVDGKRDELIVVRRDDLVGDEATAYALADNKTTDLSEFDFEIVSNQLAGLDGDLQLATGFADFEIEPLLAAEWSPAEVDEDADFQRSDSNNHKITVTSEQMESLELVFAKIRGRDGNAKLSEGECLGVMAKEFSDNS